MGIRYLLLLAAGLALADASVVTLALPPIIDELDASVEGAAAVLGSYTLVLGLALPGAAWVRVEVGSRALGTGGALVFAAASLGCGLAGSLGVLLALRGVQAVGAAAVLVAAFALLDAGETGRRAWTAVAIFGFAAGPALGGALTQALDWRAIFLVQVPIAAASAVVAWRAPEPTERHVEAASWPAGPVVALSLVSAALVGVLFLLVLLLVTGWSVSPLAAAAAVTVLPVIAVAAARIRGPARVRAAAGAALLGGGVLALASLPGASLWWTVLPQAMAGAGMGLALPALAGELLPERTPEQAARLLATRQSASPSRSCCWRRSRPPDRRRGGRRPRAGDSAGARRAAAATGEAVARRRAGRRPRPGRSARAAAGVAGPGARTGSTPRTAPHTTRSPSAPTTRS